MTESQARSTEEYGKFTIWFLRLYMLITAAAGLYMGFEIYRSFDSSDWPSARGEIERSWRTDSPTVPSVRYTYVVGEKTYRGNKVAFRDLVGVNETRRVLSRYPSGKKVRVYFNPNNPAMSVLEPGNKKGNGFWIIVPSVMFMIGMFLHRHVSATMAQKVKKDSP